MDLEQLQKEAEKDLKIDREQLDIETLKTPELYGKYLKNLTRWNLLSKQAEAENKKHLRHKWEYYSGKSEKPFELKILRQDIPTYLESDEDMIKLQSKIDYLKVVASYLEHIVKNLHNRGFQLRNITTWIKYTEGAL